MEPVAVLNLSDSVKQLIERESINVAQLADNYSDGLYVFCQNTSAYERWFGICINCLVDHDKKTKFLKSGKNLFIELRFTKDYQVIDQFYTSQKWAREIEQTLQKLLSYVDTCGVEAVLTANKIAERKLEELIPVLSNIQQNTSIQFQAAGKNVRSIALKRLFKYQTQNNKLETWNGYCQQTQRLSAQKILIVNEASNQGIALDVHSDFRILDMASFQPKFYDLIRKNIFRVLLKTVEAHNIKLGSNLVGAQQRINQLEQLCDNLAQEKKCKYQEYEKLSEEAQQAELELKDLETQLHEIKEEQKEFLRQPKLPPEIQQNLYDIKINCEQLLDLTVGDGWKVEKNEYYDKQVKNNSIVVSFYGLYNKGKSFLASKLSGKSIQFGYSVSTVGLSALYPRDLKSENSVIFLDTAGTETPIKQNQDDKVTMELTKEFSAQYTTQLDIVKQKIYEAKLKDRLLTENLLQRFILNQSHLILIIVDQLSKEEQKLIKKIKNNYKNSEIIIVHNFSKLRNIQEVQKYIQIDVIDSFDRVTEQFRTYGENIKGEVYIEERYENGVQIQGITHVIMANEYSEAGKAYNPFCYKYLSGRIVSIINVKPFDLVSQLMDEVRSQLHKLFEFSAEQKTQNFKIEYNVQSGCVTTDLRTTQLKSISFDMLGDMQVYNEDKAPKYSYTLTSDCMILEMELAGKFTPQKIDTEKKYEKFILSCKKSGCSLLEWHGFKQKEQFVQIRGQFVGQLDCQYIRTPQFVKSPEFIKASQFQLIVAIPPAICVLKPKQPDFSYENGLAKFLYSIQQQQYSEL